MTPQELARHALALLKRQREQTAPPQELILVNAAPLEGAGGDALHEFTAAAVDDPNGPSWSIVLAGDGTPRQRPPGLDPLARASRPVRVAALPPITVQRATNVLTLNPGDIVDETITVTVPRNTGPAKADIYSLPIPPAR